MIDAAELKPYHKRHNDFESFDKITFEVVPRWKESGLSGDEWRQHVEVKFYFKGHEVHSFGARSMESASLMLGHQLMNSQSPIPDKVIEVERDTCDQPSCANPPVVRCILKTEFSSSGHKLDARDSAFKHYRQFCEKHKHRGDCSREDSDSNYIVEPL